MVIGERIKTFRFRKGMTQKQLGNAIGFEGKAGEVRITQYERERRSPKRGLVKKMATVLDVNPQALTVPDIRTYEGLMHTLFALEDMYGLKIKGIDGSNMLYFEGKLSLAGANMDIRLSKWREISNMYDSGEITKEQYDTWRYTYPEFAPEYTTNQGGIEKNEEETINDDRCLCCRCRSCNRT